VFFSGRANISPSHHVPFGLASWLAARACTHRETTKSTPHEWRIHTAIGVTRVRQFINSSPRAVVTVGQSTLCDFCSSLADIALYRILHRDKINSRTRDTGINSRTQSSVARANERYTRFHDREILRSHRYLFAALISATCRARSIRPRDHSGESCGSRARFTVHIISDQFIDQRWEFRYGKSINGSLDYTLLHLNTLH